MQLTGGQDHAVWLEAVVRGGCSRSWERGRAGMQHSLVAVSGFVNVSRRFGNAGPATIGLAARVASHYGRESISQLASQRAFGGKGAHTRRRWPYQRGCAATVNHETMV